MILKFRKHVSRLVTTGAINVKKKPSEGGTSLCKESLLPKSRSMLKSFNSLLVKFNVSTQETSCHKFFSSLLYVREFFFWTIVLCRNFFLTQMHLQDIFFQNHPTPPQKLNGWPLRYNYYSTNCHYAHIWSGSPQYLSSLHDRYPAI